MAQGPKSYREEGQGYAVEVRTAFDFENSNPLQRHFLFRYHVYITNEGGLPARLESRVWHIQDAEGERRKVEGPGVVGQHPWFELGGRFDYSSFCPLPTLTGRMWGSFRMRAADGSSFEIACPTFDFWVPEEHIDRY